MLPSFRSQLILALSSWKGFPLKQWLSNIKEPPRKCITTALHHTALCRAALNPSSENGQQWPSQQNQIKPHPAQATLIAATCGSTACPVLSFSLITTLCPCPSHHTSILLCTHLLTSMSSFSFMKTLILRGKRNTLLFTVGSQVPPYRKKD